MGKRGLNKGAQLTIFVIFGILVVVGIIAFFLLLPDVTVLTGSTKDPLQEIRPCISQNLEAVLPEFFEKGLYFNSTTNLIYQNHSVAYHCFTTKKKTICDRNDAQSKSRIEEELKEKIQSSIEQCFENFKRTNTVLDIKMGLIDLSIEVLPDKILVRTRRDLEISRDGEEPLKYNNFDVYVDSPLWEFIRLSNEIINEEVSCDCISESCRADVVNLMNSNHNFKFNVFIGGKDERVYTVEDYIGTKFNFAIKNCDRSP